jgi:hypothetical protein
MRAQPNAARSWPPKAKVVIVEKIGAKCIASWIPDEEGEWLELGGRLVVDSENYLAPSEGGGDDDLNDVAPGGGVGLDIGQSRIYYRCRENESPECRILLPDNFPFRHSLQGFTKKRSKSFDENGSPVPQVRLLYALKTGDYADRLKAVESVASEVWDTQTYQQLFIAMDETAANEDNFTSFVGERMAFQAKKSGGLSDWLLWEKIADTAVEVKKDRISKYEISTNRHSHSFFLQAVKDAVIESAGFTSQADVKRRWELCSGNQGDWKELRKTLGFEWLPTAVERKKFLKSRTELLRRECD